MYEHTSLFVSAVFFNIAAFPLLGLSLCIRSAFTCNIHLQIYSAHLFAGYMVILKNKKIESLCAEM